MGNSGSGSSSGRTRGQSVAEDFQTLQQLLGDWIVDEFTFTAPTATAVVNTGFMVCRAEVGQLAINLVTNIASTGQKTAVLETFDPAQDRYEAALVDSLGENGLVIMTGRSLMTRSSEDIRARFGKAATAVIEWNVVSPQSGVEFDRLVENKISDNQWVLQFFGRTQQHGEFLVKEQVLTRASLGCTALTGCEVGCPALPGCPEGCQGLQGPTLVPPQTGCACSGAQITSPTLTAQQLIGQLPTNPLAISQLPFAGSVILQQQLLQQLLAVVPPMTAMQLIGLVPMMGAQAVCQRIPVRPPRQPVQHPGHPTQPTHGK